MSKLLGYSFWVEWIPGKNHAIADALSRSPVFATPDHKDIIVCQVTEDIEDAAMAEILKMATEDKTTILNRRYDGMKIKNLHKSHPAHQYSNYLDSLTVNRHGRMVVPEAACPKVLSNLHIQNTGKSKTLMDARLLYFWPGMTNPIQLMVANCREYTACLPSQTLEPQIPTRPPDLSYVLASILDTKKGIAT